MCVCGGCGYECVCESASSFKLNIRHMNLEPLLNKINQTLEVTSNGGYFRQCLRAVDASGQTTPQGRRRLRADDASGQTTPQGRLTLGECWRNFSLNFCTLCSSSGRGSAMQELQEEERSAK